MKDKRIIAFGMDLATVDGLEPVSMSSPRSMLDADIIITEPSLQSFFTELGEGYNGKPTLDSTSSFNFIQAKKRWISNLEAALDGGRTIVFFLTAKVERNYQTGERNVSGTGRSQRVTRIVADCSNYDFVPALNGAVFSHGKSMKLDPAASSLTQFWRRFEGLFEYNVYFSDKVGKPLVRTKAGDKVVSCLIYPERGGRILLLPEINWSSVTDAKTVTAQRDLLAKFSIELRDGLIQLDRELRSEDSENEPPEWTSESEYRLRVEGELEDEITRIGSQIERLGEQQSDLVRHLRAEARVRHLLYEKGIPLEQAVREGLETLGFSVENFKAGDSEFDALFTDGEFRFLGEVEGKDSKPINIDKASQLQRNLIEDFSREEVKEMPIGVLFGNAYRLSSPDGRPDEYFTEKVMSFAKLANIALVRTPDLFRVVRSLRDQPSEELAERCRRAIRESIGGVVVFPSVGN